MGKSKKPVTPFGVLTSIAIGLIIMSFQNCGRDPMKAQFRSQSLQIDKPLPVEAGK